MLYVMSEGVFVFVCNYLEFGHHYCCYRRCSNYRYSCRFRFYGLPSVLVLSLLVLPFVLQLQLLQLLLLLLPLLMLRLPLLLLPLLK